MMGNWLILADKDRTDPVSSALIRSSRIRFYMRPLARFDEMNELLNDDVTTCGKRWQSTAMTMLARGKMTAMAT